MFLTSSTIKESRERQGFWGPGLARWAATSNSGYSFPIRRVTVNLK